MKPDSKLSALAVRLHGIRIGVIARFAGDRHLFAFDQDYVDNPNRPTLSLSFKGQAGGLVTSVRPVSRRLPPFFSNLLPEGHPRTYLAEQAGVKPEREFFLLAALGEDLPGALTVSPLPGDGADERHHGDPDPGRNGQVLRFSLAGVQLKFSAVMEPSGGLTIPAAWAVPGLSSCPRGAFRPCRKTNTPCWNWRAPPASPFRKSAWSRPGRSRGCPGKPRAWTAGRLPSGVSTAPPPAGPSTWKISRRSSAYSRTTSTAIAATPASLRSSGPKRERKAPMNSCAASCFRC